MYFQKKNTEQKIVLINYYLVPQKLPKIYTVLVYICTGKVA